MHAGWAGGGGGGGCLENRRVGGRLHAGERGCARAVGGGTCVGVCTGLGRVARHDGVHSVGGCPRLGHSIWSFPKHSKSFLAKFVLSHDWLIAAVYILLLELGATGWHLAVLDRPAGALTQGRGGPRSLPPDQSIAIISHISHLSRM